MNSFFDENHLHYATSPDLVASPAQLRFMVLLEGDQRYYPCTERIYREIMDRVQSPVLGEQYNKAWSRIYRLVESKIEDPAQRAFLLELLHIKFLHETANYNIIPARLDKRLYKSFVVTTQIEDPMREEKTACNRRAHALYHTESFRQAVNLPVAVHEPESCAETPDVESARRRLDAAKLRRLFQASSQPDLWTADHGPLTVEDWSNRFDRPINGNGWEQLESFLLTPEQDLFGHWAPRKILYLGNQAGQIVFDLAVIRFLIRLGHTVILAVKNMSYHDWVHLGDLVNDPLLREFVEDAEIITNIRVTQSQLAAYLRNDRPFKIITDGTMEELNLLRASVTFARSFKEVDGVISKGLPQRQLFFDTPFEFTQDIYSLAPGDDGGLSVRFKARCPRAIRFSTADLQGKAERVIAEMRQAKNQGMTVMFYSGIVGSIPNETDTAILVMTTFIEYLQKQQAGTFIINPSKYFEPGMDADDLMFMWEIVQRSGYIDIWRFQTYSDIEQSFALMGQKTPPQWVGKDATFSTGSTKERIIADEVQRRNPEMQIIGPDLEKFQRRGEYGIGLFHDSRLSQIAEP